MTSLTKLATLFTGPALAAALVAGVAFAQPGEGEHHGPRGDGERRGPPPAAFDACNGKKADDACEVSFGERKMQGKCGAMPDGKLACRMAPPPEMLKACEGKKEGDACSAQMGDRKVDGKCGKGRMGGDKLMCRGEGGGWRGGRGEHGEHGGGDHGGADHGGGDHGGDKK